jgi:hypothetical protein
MTKKALAICVLPLILFAANTTSARDRLIGGWRLVSLEEPGAPKAECCGLFVFTRDGHASVQVMRSEGSNQYSRGGYEATYGTYTVDETTRTFTLHVEGALASPLVGKDLRRVYQFSGKHLIVTSADPNEHWKVTWEHY